MKTQLHNCESWLSLAKKVVLDSLLCSDLGGSQITKKLGRFQKKTCPTSFRVPHCGVAIGRARFANRN